jgi:uncharacterized protein YggE
MKIKFLTLAAAASFSITCSFAQEGGNYQFNTRKNLENEPRTPPSSANISNDGAMQTTVHGLMNIAADNYVAVFNIVQVAESPDSVDLIMNRRIASFRQKLQSIGIEAENIKVDLISFVPNYDILIENRVFSKTYNEIPSGFEMQKNVSVLYKSSATVDAIISAAAASEIFDIVKVDYFISGLERSIDSLRMLCLKEVKEKEKAYAMIGFRLDTMKKVMADNFITIYPQTRYFSYQAFSRPSLNAAKRKSSTPTLNEVHKATSKFYSPVNYDHYDIVVNPVVTGPVVQLSYTITVKYFLNEEKGNTYYIMTPSGDTKQFNPK